MDLVEGKRFQTHIRPRLPNSLNPPLTLKEILNIYLSDTLRSTIYSDNPEVTENIEELYAQIDEELDYYRTYAKDLSKFELTLDVGNQRALSSVFHQLVQDPVYDLIGQQSSESGTIELYKSRLPLGKEYSYWERIELSDGARRERILGYGQVEEPEPQGGIM